MCKRLDLSKIDNTGGVAEYDLICRCYGANGKLWPRISMRVLKTDLHRDGGHTISMSYKEHPNAWWGSGFGLPTELMPELADMLNEAHEIIMSNKK